MPTEVCLKLHRRVNLLGHYLRPPSIGEDSVAIYVFDAPGGSHTIRLLSLDPEREDVSFLPKIDQRVSWDDLSINVVLI